MVDSSVCVVIKNVQLNQTHYLDNVDRSAHFHEILIGYCRIYHLDFKSFVFLVPCEGFYSRTLSWKVAPPSMRLSECICRSDNALLSDSLLNPDDRRVYVKCVSKQDVSQFVSWNNCISTKYSKSSKAHAGITKSTLPRSISRKKKKAPLPPSSRPGSCTLDDYSQLSSHYSAISVGNGVANYGFSADNLTQGISQTGSQWSIYDDHLLTDSFSSITIKPRENYFEGSSVSENLFTPKALTPLLARDECVSDSHSVKSRRAPNPPSVTVANVTTSSVMRKSLSKDGNLVGTNRVVQGNGPTRIRAPTPALALAPQKASTLQSVKAPREGSAFNLTGDNLKQARAALKAIPPRKVATLPLRSTDEKNRPAFLSIYDRSEEKDWDSRFWYTDSRSQPLSFTKSKE